MASHYIRLARKAPLAALAALSSQQACQWTTRCDASRDDASPNQSAPDKTSTDRFEVPIKPATAGVKPDEKGDYHGLFPRRQLFQPRLDYPLWDDHWDDYRQDGSVDTGFTNEEEKRQHMRHLRKNGITRHIILIRHGQYDETHKEDEKRILTELGRTQAELTGQRLAEMVQGLNATHGPCNIKVVRVSNLARAKETADIIAKYLPGAEFADPDPILNEGAPAHHIPGGKATESVIQKTEEGHQRIEKAFQKYFYRSSDLVQSEEGKEVKEEDKHEFEIFVCHGNVIRYFFCRALQIPPEAWLRLCTFNCSLTYLTIRPTGSVSCRMMGDIGHLPYDKASFSMHHGFNW